MLIRREFEDRVEFYDKATKKLIRTEPKVAKGKRKEQQIFNFQKVNRTDVGRLIDQLNFNRDEINRIHLTPIKKMSSFQKAFALESLDAKENHILQKLFELKGFFKPGKN